MEETDMWEKFSEATSDDCEIDLHSLNGDDDDVDDFLESSDIPKLQFRKDASKARWIDDLRMSLLVERKGKLWTTTGIIRDGQIYCSLYETLYLVEIGALHVVDGDETSLVLGGGSSFSWESFEAYKHLKALGYIVGQHNIPWTMKRAKVDDITSHSAASEENVRRGSVLVSRMFEHLQIDDLTPLFDVYLPDSKFKKSSPGSSSFILCRTSDHPPTNQEIEKVERQCSGKPLKFFSVDHGRHHLNGALSSSFHAEPGEEVYNGCLRIEVIKAIIKIFAIP